MLPVKQWESFTAVEEALAEVCALGGGAAGERAKGTQGTGTSQCGTESTAAGGARRLTSGAISGVWWLDSVGMGRPFV